MLRVLVDSVGATDEEVGVVVIIGAELALVVDWYVVCVVGSMADVLVGIVVFCRTG